MNWLADNWLTLVTTIVGLVATVAVSHYYAMKGKATRIIRCKVNSLNYISASVARFPGLTVRYTGYGEALENFTITDLLIWNGGTEAIRKGDVAIAEPIAIVMKEGCTILDYNLVKTNNSASRVDLSRSKEKTKLRISFDHLNISDGMHIALIHTGKGSADVVVEGSIVGGGKVERMPPVPVTVLHQLGSFAGWKWWLFVFTLLAGCIGFDVYKIGHLPQTASFITGGLAAWVVDHVMGRRRVHKDFAIRQRAL